MSAPKDLIVEPAGADAAAATTGASVLAGGVWKTASTFVPQLYVLVQSVVAARFLGPTGMGVQSFIAFAEISIVAAFSSGASIALMRYIGETLGRGQAGVVQRLVRWAWWALGVGALLGGLVLVVAGLTGSNPRAAWLLAGVAAALGIVHTVPSAVLIGAQRWRDASVVGLVTGTLATAAIVAVLALGGGITGMFAVEAVTAAFNLAWTSALARRAFPQEFSGGVLPRELRFAVSRYALVSTLSAIMTFIVWRRSELFFLKHYSTDREIAFYSVAFAAVTALTALPQALSTVVSPAVATLFGAGADARIRAGYARGMRLLLVVSLPLTAASFALGPSALKLVYGGPYSDTGSVLLILLAPLPFIPILTYARAFVAGLGRLRASFVMSALAAIVNVALDFVLIPHRGAVAAAVANSTAQLLAGIPVLVYTARHVGRVDWRPAMLARGFAVSALAGAAGWLVDWAVGGPGGLVAGLATAALGFALFGSALKILPADDADWLDEAIGHRFGGRVGRLVHFFARSTEPRAAS